MTNRPRTHFHSSVDLELITAHIDAVMERLGLNMSIFALRDDKMNHKYRPERELVYFEAINTPLADGRWITPFAFCRAMSLNRTFHASVRMGLERETKRRHELRAKGGAQ